MFFRPAILLSSLLVLATSVRADVRCAAVFGDHMVLQRDHIVAVWGDADPNEPITVDFAGQAVKTTSSAAGHWLAHLAPLAASAEPRPLTVRGNNTIEFSDVLVGEVWLCSGQSNMEKPLGPRRGQKPTDEYEAAIRAANHPLLRLYQMPQYGRPQKNVLGLTWVVCTPEAVAQTEFSAAGYYFGRALQQALGVPVGLIHSSYGGTQIETWIPDRAFANHPAIRDLRHVQYQTWVKGLQATELYDSMIAPLVPYTLRGFLWYQGETNCMQADGAIYTEKMRALIDGWRAAWNEPDAPWYYVQIAPFDYSRWTTFPKWLTPEELPVFWEAQARARAIPHTGMVGTTDLVKNLHDIHPTDKKDVGERLAHLALADTYGREELVAHSPSFAGMQARANGRVELRFKDAGTGLRTRDGKPPTDFTIAGADRKFVKATAEIDGDRVIVFSPDVSAPAAVRFAWSETATPNLVNSAGLPAVAFRTDDWPVVVERPRPAPVGTTALENAFAHPNEAAKPWVFWYWLNAAVTKAGITADLTAMKAAGLEGAYLMPIKGPAQPPLLTPPVVQLSPAWWDGVKFAFAEADRLGLKLALHDCDGFATAGGPWITPAESMQKVVWTETPVKGGQPIALSLPQPETKEDYYRDIAVFAVPAAWRDGNAERSGSAASPVVTTDRPGPAPQFLANETSAEVFQSNAACWLQYAYPEPFTCRSITIKLPPAPNAYQPNTYQANRLTVEASDDGAQFRPVAKLVPPRHGWQDGDADVTHAVPETTARFFRLHWDPADAEPGAEDLDSAKWKPVLKLRSVVLSAEPRIDGFEGKAGAVWRVSPPTSDAQVPAARCVPLDKVVNLSARIDANGRLNWDAPAGNWMILRMGHTSTGHHNETGGGGRGLECDKFNPDVVKKQYEHWFGEIVRQVGPELSRRVLKIFHVDSWECGSQNWSPVFRDEFRRRRGYDPLPYLPAMAGVPIGTVDVTERFLRDVRTTIAELIADNFYGTMASLAHAQGCDFTAESVAPTMVSDGMAHFVNVDVPMGEFWLRSATHDKLNDILDAVSGAHTYGRSVVQAEAFTEIGLSWDEAPWMLKTLQDRNYGFGINRFVYHVFAENPWPERRPGMTLGGVGLFFQTNQTWWQPGRAWVQYAERCQSVLQQGHPVADVAVFTGEEIPRRAMVPWELKATLPGMVASVSDVMIGRKTPRIIEAGDWIDPLHGYAYDSINRDTLVHLAHVRDGRIELPGGASYSVLIVPAANHIDPAANLLTPEVLQRLREFAHGGVTVILGERPLRSASLEQFPACDAAVGALADELWPAGAAEGASRNLGRGRVVTGPFRAATFAPLGLSPDVITTGPDGKPVPKFTWTHRAGDNWDAYFVSNQSDELRELTISFRITGRAPELWDPVTGLRHASISWRANVERTDVPLRLPPAGSVFVVFRTPTKERAANGPVFGRELPVTQTLAGPWQVTFDHANGGPPSPVVFPRLVSWTEQKDAGIRNYSGTATYQSAFEWKASAAKPAHVWLDLGKVRDIAEVAVNGVPCGVAWTVPFRVDVAPALRDGTNELRVVVTNTWFNRLAGDRDRPETERITWTTAPDRTAGKPLLEAGMFGPVTLRVE